VFAILRDATVPSEKPLLVAGGLLILLVIAGIVLQVMRKRGMLTRLRDWIRPLADAPRALLNRSGVMLLLGSFVIWATEASVYLAIAHATSLDINPMDALYLVALTNLFAMLPAAPGYVGTFDAAVIYGVHAIGGSKNAALSYLVLLRFILFVPITVVGLIVLVTRYGGWSRFRAAIRFDRDAPANEAVDSTAPRARAATDTAV
jgi:glycosyltransferase 2 family protein